jgi:hypothetical protein
MTAQRTMATQEILRGQAAGYGATMFEVRCGRCVRADPSRCSCWSPSVDRTRLSGTSWRSRSARARTVTERRSRSTATEMLMFVKNPQIALIRSFPQADLGAVVRHTRAALMANGYRPTEAVDAQSG